MSRKMKKHVKKATAPAKRERTALRNRVKDYLNNTISSYECAAIARKSPSGKYDTISEMGWYDNGACLFADAEKAMRALGLTERQIKNCAYAINNATGA